MPLKIHKLLRMTYNDISEFFGIVELCLAPDDRRNVWLKKKGFAFLKYTAIIKRSDKWNLE